jgi:hypothetical protein
MKLQFPLRLIVYVVALVALPLGVWVQVERGPSWLSTVLDLSAGYMGMSLCPSVPLWVVLGWLWIKRSRAPAERKSSHRLELVTVCLAALNLIAIVLTAIRLTTMRT